jgi:hypothetical protein
MKRRALKFFLPGFAALMLAGCAGYHLGPVNGAVAGEKSIEVLPFNNQTLQPRLGAALTESLREHLQTDATYHLATSSPGDVIVTGVIRSYSREGLGYLSTDAATPENYRVDAVAHVTVRDRASGKLLLDKDVKGHTLVHVGADLASAERQSLPLLADDLAQNITELLTEGAW